MQPQSTPGEKFFFPLKINSSLFHKKVRREFFFPKIPLSRSPDHPTGFLYGRENGLFCRAYP
ncbi:Hypothetical protein Minf_1107 [Methylacidiphilum infernorum V4]|uniref:Uncharacterized protein n=1 Tax=Methylacidiphilum infernorum (isolate V4) TaxID=481448 RepID=B3DV09_METI4|nr:Hypothetical protein Minf_1107 [Methylacidiphilum infernorum V4]